MRKGVLPIYLIRAHLGPFLFALATITGLLFVNAVAQRVDSLVGKGLPWQVIVEFLILSVPHTIALSLPMAVLVAVLYAFSDMAASNEITAMSRRWCPTCANDVPSFRPWRHRDPGDALLQRLCAAGF